MAVTIVGTAKNFQAVAATSPAFSSVAYSAGGTGNLMVLKIAVRTGATISVSSVADNASHTWTNRAVGYASGSSTRVEIWTTTRNGSAISTITVNLSASAVASIQVMELTGQHPTNPIITSQGTTTGDATSDTTYNFGPITPTAGENGIIIAGVSFPVTTNVTTWTPSTGWTSSGFQSGSSTLQGHGGVYQFVNGMTGSYSGSVTTNRATTNGWAMIAIRELTTVTKTATPVTMSLQATNTETATPVTAALSLVSSRTASATISLAYTVSRTATPVTLALSGSATRTAPATLALSGSATRTAPATIALDVTVSRSPVTIATGQISAYNSADETTNWSSRSLFAYRTAIQAVGTHNSANLGISTNLSAVAQSFVPSAAMELVEARISVIKSGTPTDNLTMEIRSDSGSNTPSSTVLATALNVHSGPSMSFTNKSWLPYMFAGLSLNSGTKYWLVLQRTGAVDVSNYYQLSSTQASVLSGAGTSNYNSGTSAWTSENTNSDLYFQILQKQPIALYAVTQDTSVHVWRSTNLGASWSEQDSANAPTVFNSLYPFDADHPRTPSMMLVSYFTAVNTVSTKQFDMLTNTWVSGTYGTTPPANVSNERNIRIAGRNLFSSTAPTSSATCLAFADLADDADATRSDDVLTPTSAWPASFSFASSATSVEATMVADVVVDKAWGGFIHYFYYHIQNFDYNVSTLGTGGGGGIGASISTSAADTEVEHAAAVYQTFLDASSYIDSVIAAYIDPNGLLRERILTLQAAQAGIVMATDNAVNSDSGVAGRQFSTAQYNGVNYIAANSGGHSIIYYQSSTPGTWSSGTTYANTTTITGLSRILSIEGVGLAILYTENGNTKFDWIVAPTGGGSTVTKTATPVTMALSQTRTRTATPTAALSQTKTRTASSVTMALGGSPTTYSGWVLQTPGVMGYWKLDELSGAVSTVVADQTGFNDASVLFQPITAGATSLIGDGKTAFDYSGFTGAVRTSSSSGTPTKFAVTACSIEFWIKYPAWVGNGVIFQMIKQSTASAHQWVRMSFPTPGALSVILQTTGGGINTLVNTTMTTNTRYHIVITYDSGGLKVYQDGTLVDSIAGAGDLLTSGFTDMYAQLGGDSGSNFGGILDEVAFYNTVLSSTDVTNHYNAGLAITGYPTVTKTATPVTMALSATKARAATPITIAVYSPDKSRTATPVTAALSQARTRTATPTAALSQVRTRAATPITTALQATLTRTGTPTAALSQTRTRTASATVSVGITPTRTATPVTMALINSFTRTATPITAALGITATRTATPTVALSQTRTRTATPTMVLGTVFTRTATPITTALLATFTRTASATAALMATPTRAATPITVSVGITPTRTAPATMALSATLTRTAPATIALSGAGNFRNASPVTIALLATLTRTASASIALSRLGITRTATPITVSLGTTSIRSATPVTMALSTTATRSATPVTAALMTTRTRTASATAAISQQGTRTATPTAALSQVSTRTSTPVTVALTVSKTRISTPVTLALMQARTRTAAATLALSRVGTRNATPVTAAFSSVRTRTVSNVTISLYVIDTSFVQLPVTPVTVILISNGMGASTVAIPTSPALAIVPQPTSPAMSLVGQPTGPAMALLDTD